VPIGGDSGPVRGKLSPRFTVGARQDPGGNGEPSTPLQRIQIIKGWVDAQHVSHEKVFDIAGGENGATVDPSTCATSGPGTASLCAVWEDPAFHPEERAFYYARVLENPVCRWSTELCNSLAVDCSNPGSVPSQYAECCSGIVDKVIQERAWTSPIFYQPERIGVKGRILYGDPGSDRLHLEVTIGRVPPELDVNANPLTLTLSDDDVIYTATLPAGTMVMKSPGKSFAYKDNTGAIGGIRKASLKITRRGTGRLKIDTIATDLSNADQSSHRVTVHVASGTYDQSDDRTWELMPGRLDAQR